MMKQNARVFKVILRFSALFCFFLSPFPVFSLIVQKVKLPAVYYLYSVLMLELCGFFGFGLRALLESMRRIRSFLISILLVLFGIVFSFGACLAFASLGIHPVYIVILTVTVGILYIFSVRMISHAYDEILTRNWFLFSSGFNIFCLLVSRFVLTILYPQFVDEAMKLIPISTLSLCVSSFVNIIHPLALKSIKTNRQIIISGAGLLCYVVLALTLYKPYGLMGCCIALLISYIVKLGLILLYCFVIDRSVRE